MPVMMFNGWEYQIVKIKATSLQKCINICNVYRSPCDQNESYKKFITDMSEVLNLPDFKNGDNLLAGDFNINLFKLSEKVYVGKFLEMMIAQGYFPKLTLPTRFSEKRGTLIDNIFCKLSNNANSVESGIILSDISDHLPCFACIDFPGKFEPPPKIFKAFQNFANDLSDRNILSQLMVQPNIDPNESYSILELNIKLAKEKHLPIKNVRFNKRKHKVKPWITYRIIKSINHRDRLNKKLKQTKPNSLNFTRLKLNLKTFNMILKKTIRNAKTSYYHEQFDRYNKDSRNT